MQRLPRAAASALFLVLVAASSHGQGLSIALAPPFIEKQVRPSGKVSDTIVYTNDSDLTVFVTVDFADFAVDSSGEVQEMPAGTDPSSSLAKYLRISPIKIRVPPRGRTQFRYSVDPPADFKQLRSQIFFSTRPVVAGAPNQVLFVARMGVPLYVESLSSKPASIEVQELKWDRVGEKKDMLGINILAHNAGDRNIRPTGFCEIRSADGSFAKTFPFNDGNEPVLPGQRRRWEMSYGPLPGGELSVRLRFESSRRTSFEREFRVPAVSAPSSSP